MPRVTGLSDVNPEKTLQFRLDDCIESIEAIGRGNDTEEDRVLLAQIQEQVEMIRLSITAWTPGGQGDRDFEEKCSENISEIEKDIAALGEILPYPREYLIKW